MHKPTPYENYLFEQNKKYGFFWLYSSSEWVERGIPSWLIHEYKTYYWIFDLIRKMRDVLDYSNVPSQIQFRISTIETIRFRKYENISPVLKESVEEIVSILSELHTDLQDPGMWKRRNLLSYKGHVRWERAYHDISPYTYIIPDVDWREEWIKENL